MAKVEHQHFESAGEFLNALRRSNQAWLGERGWDCPWIFRGQRMATRNLVPSAWRDNTGHYIWKQMEKELDDKTHAEVFQDANKHGFPSTTPELVKKFVVQSMFEYAAVLIFVRKADELGFRIPGERLQHHVPRPQIHNLTNWNQESFIPENPTTALAQHHKVPTRLLDWTFNPLVAAFFAAERAKPEDEGEIAVWAYRHDVPVRPYPLIQIVTVPRHDVGFLRAQEGLFTHIKSAKSLFLINGSWPRFEVCAPEGSLKKLTLPNRMAPDSIRMLWAERISRAHLMPTLDNVTEALQHAWKSASAIPPTEPAAPATDGNA